MERCIYCRSNLNNNEAPDAMTTSTSTRRTARWFPSRLQAQAGKHHVEAAQLARSGRSRDWIKSKRRRR